MWTPVQILLCMGQHSAPTIAKWPKRGRFQLSFRTTFDTAVLTRVCNGIIYKKNIKNEKGVGMALAEKVMKQDIEM